MPRINYLLRNCAILVFLQFLINYAVSLHCLSVASNVPSAPLLSYAIVSFYDTVTSPLKPHFSVICSAIPFYL